MSFIENLNTELDAKHLLMHSYYQAWSRGELTLENLGVYVGQYQHQVNAFPNYISATHANCPSMAAGQELMKNLQDELDLCGDADGSENHPELWLRFAEGVGVSRETMKNTALFPETKHLVDTFMQLAKSSYAEGVGALYAYERQVPAVAASKIDGLKKFYGVDSEQALKFFNVHLEADIHHANATQKLLEDLSAEEQQQAATAANKIAAALWGFLDGMQGSFESSATIN